MTGETEAVIFDVVEFYFRCCFFIFFCKYVLTSSFSAENIVRFSLDFVVILFFPVLRSTLRPVSLQFSQH